MSDFTHYETMVPRQSANRIKNDKKDKKKSEKQEVFWCKQFQKGVCTDKSPHMATIKQDEPPVPVMHICAHCFQKDNSRAEHGEAECPKK